MSRALRPAASGMPVQAGPNRSRLQQRIAEQPFRRAAAGEQAFRNLRSSQQSLIEQYTAAGYSRFEIQRMVKGMTMKQAESYLSKRFDTGRYQQYAEWMTRGGGASRDPGARENVVSLARWQHMPEHLKIRMMTGVHVSQLQKDDYGNPVVPQGYFQPKTDTRHVYPTDVITKGSHLSSSANQLITTFKSDKLLKRTALLGKHEMVELRGIGGMRRASWRSNEWSKEPEPIQVLRAAAVVGGDPGPAGQIYFSNKIREAAQRITTDVWDERGTGLSGLPKAGQTFAPGAGITLAEGRTPINVGDKWGHRVLDVHDIEQQVQSGIDPATGKPIYSTQRGKRMVLEQFAPIPEALVRGKAFWQKGVGTTADLSDIQGASSIQMLSGLKDVGGYAYAYWMARPQQELAQAIGRKLEDVQHLSYAELGEAPLRAFEKLVQDPQSGLLQTIQRPQIVSAENLRDLEGKYTGTPEALGGGRFRVMREYQALVGPVAMQASTDFPVRNPFLGHDELQALKLRDRGLYDRVMQGGASTQQAYKNIVNAALATTGEFQLPEGAVNIDQSQIDLPYEDAAGAQQMLRYRGAGDIISATTAAAKAELPGLGPGETIPRNVLQRHFAELWKNQENFTVVPTGRGDIVLPPGSALERFRASGSYEGEEVSQMVGRTFDLLTAYRSGDKAAIDEAALRYQQQQLTIAGGENTIRRAMGAYVNNRDMLGTVVRGDLALRPNEVYVPGMEGQEISMFRFPTQGGNEYSMSFRGMSKKEAMSLGLDPKSMYTSIQLQQALAGDYDGDLAYALRVGAIQTDKNGNLVTQSGRKLSGVQDVLNSAKAALNQGAGDLVEEYAGGISKEDARKKIIETIQGASKLTPEQLQKQLIADKGMYDKIGQYYNTFTRGMASLPGGNRRQQLAMRGALQKVFNISHGFAQRPAKLPAGAQHIQDLMTYNLGRGSWRRRGAGEGDNPWGDDASRGLAGLRDEALNAALTLHVGDDPTKPALSSKDVARLNLPMGATRQQRAAMTRAVSSYRGAKVGSREQAAALKAIQDLTGTPGQWANSAMGSMLGSRAVYRTAMKEAEELDIDPREGLAQFSFAGLRDFQTAEGQPDLPLLQSLFDRGLAQEQAVLARRKPKGITEFGEKAKDLASRALAWGGEFVGLRPQAEQASFNAKVEQPPTAPVIEPTPAPVEEKPQRRDRALDIADRRQQAMGLASQGYTYKQIASMLGVSESTVGRDLSGMRKASRGRAQRREAAAPATPPPPPPPSEPPNRVEGVGAGMEYDGGLRGGGPPGGGEPPNSGPGNQRPIELSPPKISAVQLKDLRIMNRLLPQYAGKIPSGAIHKNENAELWRLSEAAYRQQLNMGDIRKKAFAITAQGNPLNATPEQVRAAHEVIGLTDFDSPIAQQALEVEDLRDLMIRSKNDPALDPIAAERRGIQREMAGDRSAQLRMIDRSTRAGRKYGQGVAAREAGRAGSAFNLAAQYGEIRSGRGGTMELFDAYHAKHQEYLSSSPAQQRAMAPEINELVDKMKELKEAAASLTPEIKDHRDSLASINKELRGDMSSVGQRVTAARTELRTVRQQLASGKLGDEEKAFLEGERGRLETELGTSSREYRQKRRQIAANEAQIEALRTPSLGIAGATRVKPPPSVGSQVWGELSKGYDPQRLFYQSQALMQGYYMLGLPLLGARQQYLDTQFSVGQAQYALGSGGIPDEVIDSQINQANLSKAVQGLGHGVENSWVMRGVYGLSEYLADNESAATTAGSALTGALALGGGFFGGKMLLGPPGRALRRLGAGAINGLRGAMGARNTTTMARLAQVTGNAAPAAAGGNGLLAALGGSAVMMGGGALGAVGAGVLVNEAFAGSQWDLGEKAGSFIQSGLENFRSGNPLVDLIARNIGAARRATGTENQIGFESLSKYWDIATGGGGAPDQKKEESVSVHIKSVEAEVARLLGKEKAPMEEGETAQYVKAFAEYSGVTHSDIESRGTKFQDLTQMIAESKRSGISFDEFFKYYQAAPETAGYAPGTAAGYGFQQWVTQGSLFEREQRFKAVQAGASVAGFMGMNLDQQEAYNQQIYQMRRGGASDFQVARFQSMRSMGTQYDWSAAAYESGHPELALMGQDESWRPKYQREMWAIEDRRRQEDVSRELGTRSTIIDAMGQTITDTWSGGRQEQEIEWQGKRLEMEERFWTKKREWQQQDFEMGQKMFDFQVRQMEYNLDREEKYAKLSERNYLRNYEIQRKIFDLQTGWQRDDFQKQGQRMEVRRAWQVEDFAANREAFELQSGWQLEDMQRSLRYATGRERMDIRRQMERAEIMGNFKRDQMTREESRATTQYEWSKEDLETAKARFEELRPLQEAQMELGLEYWRQQKELGEEDRERRRQFAQEQIGLMKEQNALNVQQYNEKRAMDEEEFQFQQQINQQKLEWQEQDLEIARQRAVEDEKLIEWQREMTEAQEKYAAFTQMGYEWTVKTVPELEAMAKASEKLADNMAAAFQIKPESGGGPSSAAMDKGQGVVPQQMPMGRGGATFSPTSALLSEYGQEEHVVPSGGSLILREPGLITEVRQTNTLLAALIQAVMESRSTGQPVDMGVVEGLLSTAFNLTYP